MHGKKGAFFAVQRWKLRIKPGCSLAGWGFADTNDTWFADFLLSPLLGERALDCVLLAHPFEVREACVPLFHPSENRRAVGVPEDVKDEDPHLQQTQRSQSLYEQAPVCRREG